jgi:hypothetical protein
VPDPAFVVDASVVVRWLVDGIAHGLPARRAVD